MRRNVDLKIPQNAGEFAFLDAEKNSVNEIGSMPLQDLPSVANAVAPKARSAIDRYDWVIRNEVLKPFNVSEESEKAASQTVLTSRQKIDLKLDSESPWKLKLTQMLGNR